MEQIIFYRTWSYGGGEGRDRVKRDFETLELALEDALQDTWNNNFRLYEITLTFNGRITETSEFLGKIPCYRNQRREQSRENNKQLMEEVLKAQVKLPDEQLSKLTKMLIEYCKNNFFLSFNYTPENKQYLDASLVWAIKRLEQRINPRTNNTTGSLVIGDGTCLANAQTYFNILVSNKPSILESYLKEYQDGEFYLQEYLARKLLNTATIKNRSKAKQREQ